LAVTPARVEAAARTGSDARFGRRIGAGRRSGFSGLERTAAVPPCGAGSVIGGCRSRARRASVGACECGEGRRKPPSLACGARRSSVANPRGFNALEILRRNVTRRYAYRR
jgi:hypothetical protein